MLAAAGASGSDRLVLCTEVGKTGSPAVSMPCGVPSKQAVSGIAKSRQSVERWVLGRSVAVV